MAIAKVRIVGAGHYLLPTIPTGSPAVGRSLFLDARTVMSAPSAVVGILGHYSPCNTKGRHTWV